MDILMTTLSYTALVTALLLTAGAIWWLVRPPLLLQTSKAFPPISADAVTGESNEESPDQPMRAIAPDDPSAVYAVGLLVPLGVSAGEKEAAIEQAQKFFLPQKNEEDTGRSLYIDIEGVRHPGRLYTVSTEPLPIYGEHGRTIMSDGGLQLSEATSTVIMRARLTNLMRERGADYGVIIQAGTSAKTEFEKL